MSGLERVKTESLRSQVYVQLKNKLIEGEWQAGDKLPSENKLCETFGVSRVTVRAAIQQLEILGLVETKHGGGTFVRSFSSVDAVDALHPFMKVNKHSDIITVLEYRKIIEHGTIGLAVKNVTERDLAYLEETVKQMQASVVDPEKEAEVDLNFHLRIAEMSKNPIVIKVYTLISEILSNTMVELVRLIGSEVGITYHRKLLDALRARDKSLCETLMDEHIDRTIQAALASDEK